MKAPIVILSGWAHPARCLQPLAAALAPAGPVTCLDTRDLYGQEPVPAMIRPPAGLFPEQPFTLVGWSLGGLLALAMAETLNARLRRLVLVSATPRFCQAADFPEGVPERNLRALALSVQRAPRAAIERFSAEVAHPFPGSDAERAAAAEELGRDRLLGDLEYLRRCDHRAAATALRAPLLALHGRLDAVIAWPAGAWFARHAPNTRFVLCEAIGHDLPLRRPEWIAEQIRLCENPDR